jgi:hypothetical protein
MVEDRARWDVWRRNVLGFLMIWISMCFGLDVTIIIRWVKLSVVTPKANNGCQYEMNREGYKIWVLLQEL